MKSLTIIGCAVGTVLAGCASTSGARSEPTKPAASAPAHRHDHGDQAGMMAGMCPMQVPGTSVVATEVDGGIGLSFTTTTTTGNVAELRQRLRRMAEMHNQPGGHRMMENHGRAAPGADAEHQHGAESGAGHKGGGRGGMMMGGGMMMPAATASVEDIEGGARIVLQPKDPAQLGSLREHVGTKAKRMAAGDCPMMSRGSGGEPAAANPGDADHDAGPAELEAAPPGPPAVEVGHGEAHGSEPSGHHALTHPFLSHMALPDGPGEVSVRVTGIQRGVRDSAESDVAFHVEAGIVNRLGLHLRNDAITGAGMSSPDGEMEDHGTELMLVYAVLQDAEATRGLSVFAEVAVPTVRRDGPSIKYGGGVGGRFTLASRLQWDAIVHVSPADGGGVELGYEGALVVRAAGRVFGVVETRGEIGHGDVSNYVLFASKVGLGQSGATIGAGVQFATTSARTYDRQAMFQVDWGF